MKCTPYFRHYSSTVFGGANVIYLKHKAALTPLDIWMNFTIFNFVRKYINLSPYKGHFYPKKLGGKPVRALWG